MEKSTPVPDSDTVSGVSSAESAMVSEPDSGPATVGEKVSEIVHFAEGASVEPQVVTSAKSPVAVIELMVKGDFAVFWTVIL